MNNSNRQIRRKELTKKELKNAFIDLILENDNKVESITISDITNRADFNRGTFYIHYQDKIALLEDLYEDAIEGIHQSLIKPYKNTIRVLINKDVPSINLIFEHIEKHKKLYKVLDVIEEKPDIYNRLESFLWNLFTEEIQIEQAYSLNTEYEILLSFQIHATLGVIKYWIKKDFIYSANFMTEQLTSFYTNNVIAMNFKKT